MAISTVVFIGAGRVATRLGLSLIKESISVLQVYSRTIESASALASLLKCNFTNDITSLTKKADLYIISISDNFIAEIAGQLHLQNKIVVHTSGSVPIEILKNTSNHFGVFYPLNTFIKEKIINLSTTPFCIEASDDQTEEKLIGLASRITSDVRQINSKERAVIHLAAVFACNFTNFMMVNADEILKANGISFDILMPLIGETIEKLYDISPKMAQTGPAIRNDTKVMQKHLEMLKNDPNKSMIYQLLNSQISNFFETDKNKADDSKEL